MMVMAIVMVMVVVIVMEVVEMSHLPRFPTFPFAPKTTFSDEQNGKKTAVGEPWEKALHPI